MTRVTFEGRRYVLLEGESILDGLLRGGANAEFSCRKGTCHACLLRATSGDAGDSARAGLPPDMALRGYFLPCKAHPSEDVEAARPDPSELTFSAVVAERQVLAPAITRLRLEPERNISWRPGQLLNISRKGGPMRSYSIASVQEDDYFLELHVQRHPEGSLSPWLCDEARPGDEVLVQGPRGSTFYDPAMADRNLLLVATGTGLGPLLGVARDALRQEHRADIFLYHGSRSPDGLYLEPDLRALEARHPRFHYVPTLSGPDAGSYVPGRASEVALARHPSLEGWVIFAAGRPEMVFDLRARAVGAGAERAHIHTDSFESGQPFMPNDAAKVAATPPEPELWAALGEGPLLFEILSDFYTQAYADPLLSPFFHNVTKQRAIEKQYQFLADLFSGRRAFFGLRPFNAHHWMVISDELFDYRERMMEACMRARGLSDALILRWSAVHEHWRREIVKSTPRGLILDGVEQPVDGYSEETLTVGSMCDGCEGEIPMGATGRMHVRTGKVYCQHCASRRVGMTLPPPG